MPRFDAASPPLSEYAQRAAQTHRENLMRERGERRAKKAIAQALERGEAADTPAGVQLARRAVAPLADAIRAFLEPRKGAGRRHTAAALLKGIDPELAAYVTVRATLGFANSRKPVHSAAMFLTDMLEAEVIAERFEQANGALYRAVIRNAQARGLSPQRQAKAVGLANRQFAVVEKPWAIKQRVHLGTKLIELMIESLGIVEAKLTREGRRANTHRLQFTPEIEDWMRKYNDAAALTRPMLLPTVVPPKPWEGPRDGAYYTLGRSRGRDGVPLVTRAFPGQGAALEEATKAGTMGPVYKGLNGLQGTPWRINRRVLGVMKVAWEGNLPGLPIPGCEPEPKPEAPQAVKDDVKGGEHRRAWRRHMRAWHEREAKNKAARFELARALAIAEENVEFPAIYFPHRLDFRGRCYSVGTTLHPQGPMRGRCWRFAGTSTIV